jgi:hypothetical protein
MVYLAKKDGIPFPHKRKYHLSKALTFFYTNNYQRQCRIPEERSHFV